MQWNWIGRSVSGLVKRHGGGVGSGSLARLVIFGWSGEKIMR